MRDDDKEGYPEADDERWMHLALDLAQRGATMGEVPVGAVVVRDGEVLATGCNQPIGSHDPTAHAEIVALRAAAARVGNYRLSDTTLYVTIEPCTMCVGAMIHARVARLVFGAREPRAGAVYSQHQLCNHAAYNHRIVVVDGVLETECAALMRDFFRNRRQG